MKVINNIIERIFGLAAIFLFIILIMVVFAQVIARNYLKIPLLWSEEVSLFCFIWSVFLGAAIAVRRRNHFIVDIFPDRFQRINISLDIFASLLVFLFIYVLVFSGYTYSIMGLSRMSYSIPLPRAYYFMSIPVSGLAMFLFNLEILILDLKKAIILFQKGGIHESTDLSHG